MTRRYRPKLLQAMLHGTRRCIVSRTVDTLDAATHVERSVTLGDFKGRCIESTMDQFATTRLAESWTQTW